MEASGPARPRRRGLPRRAQVAHRARPAGAAPHGGEHRRGRAGHLQGPALPRARPASLPRGHAGRRLGGGHRAPSTSTCATNTTRCRAMLERELAALKADPPVRRPAAHRAAPRRRRLHLRRRVRDDRVDRGQARHAAPAPAVRRAGGPVRPARRSSTTWRRCTGCATSSRRAPAWFAAHGRNGRKGLRSFSVSGRVAKPGRAPGARRHHAARADRRVLRRHARRATSSTPTCPAAPPAASCPRAWRDMPLDFDTLQPHGCFIGSAAVIVLSQARPRARRRAEPHALLRARELRPVHALPRGHRQGGAT